jgi:glycosyltransferase involved in cell wall biosynthesis
LFAWSTEHPLPDLFHFIGFPPYLARIAELVRQKQKPYVITLLFGSQRNRADLIAFAARRAIKAKLSSSWQISDAVANASAIVAITEPDAEAARVIYNVPKRKLHIVPNGVADIFFNASPNVWHQKFGAKPFILCVGAIQRRKNQLLLLETCNKLSLPVVLIGPVLPGEDDYSDAVGKAAELNAKIGGQWLTNLTNEDPLLASAYAACKVFVLLSESETQPLSIMQAMASNKPVLLLKSVYVNQKLFSGIPAVVSKRPEVLRAAIQQAWSSPAIDSLSPEYTWKSVAAKLTDVYKSILR